MAYEFTKDDIKERLFSALVSDQLEQTQRLDNKRVSVDPLAQTQNPLKANVFPAISQQLTQRGIEVKENEIERILAETLTEKLSSKKEDRTTTNQNIQTKENIERK